MDAYNARFVKDMKLPISIYNEPYFSYLLTLTDPYYDSVRKHAIFKKDIEEKGYEGFSSYNKQFIRSVLDDLKAKPEYKAFNEMDMSRFSRQTVVPKRELYTSVNKGKRFISIDLVKANFQSFNYAIPDFFDGYTTYNSFMESRSISNYLKESKLIRQVIFGEMNPKRQQSVQSYMMSLIAETLRYKGVDTSRFYSLSSDELVFEAGNNSEFEIMLFLEELPFDFRVEEFVLDQPFKQAYFVKRFTDNRVDFRMVPTAVMAEFIKRFEGRDVEEQDLFFYDENKRLARYMTTFIES